MTEDEGYSSRIFGSSKTEFDFEIKVERGKKNFEYFEHEELYFRADTRCFRGLYKD